MSQIPEGQPELTPEEQAVADEAARTVGWAEVLERRRQAAAQPQNTDQPSPDAPPAAAPAGTAPAPVSSGPSADEVQQMVRDEVAKGFEALATDLKAVIASQTPAQPGTTQEAPQAPPAAPGVTEQPPAGS